ncbi:unnamed protein product [Dibothriocephalus latus]|uniref:Sulfhydryl oxidase n=1 Tax=Dibothriocephalus latus TaxID=60516 RepID=A0A3P7N8X1_DIBLA|nr:unnamed protein product [Dibothriocephalus latus]
MHTMAAYYPNHPTYEQKASIEQFFNSFAQFYPCKYCAMDFQKMGVSSKKWLGSVCQNMKLVLKPPIFGLRRSREEWVELSTSAATDHYAWRSTIRDIIVEAS